MYLNVKQLINLNLGYMQLLSFTTGDKKRTYAPYTTTNPPVIEPLLKLKEKIKYLA